jgi:cytoskeletal protein RodZ
MHRARARRRLAVSSGVVGALVVVLGAGALLAGQNSHLDVRGHPTTLPASSSTSSTLETTTTHLPTGSSTTTPTSPGTPTTPSTDDRGGTSLPGAGSTTTPPSAAPVTTTYTAIGGRVTITFARGALTLDSSTPTAGYQVEVHKQDPDDVEVRFSNGSRESRIRIRVQNGAVEKEIVES